MFSVLQDVPIEPYHRSRQTKHNYIKIRNEVVVRRYVRKRINDSKFAHMARQTEKIDRKKRSPIVVSFQGFYI